MKTGRNTYGALIIFILYSSFASSHSSFLSENECLAENDPVAKAILDDVKELYNSHSDITIYFTLNVHLAERPETSEKGMIIQQGERFKVEMKDQDIYCDGEDLWYHLKTKNEVQINDYEGGEDIGIVSPADLLKQYESGEFDYALFKEYSQKGKNKVEIEFKPNDSFSDYSKLRVTIDKDSNLIKKVIAFGKDGSQFIMTIDQEIFDKQYPLQTFVFDPSLHPDVIIEDLRLD